jgi:hypothetical protein
MLAMRTLGLEPVIVPEWDAEDLMAGSLASELEPLGPEQARELLNRVRLELPDELDHRELGNYSATRGTPLEATLQPDLERFDFHLVEVPLTVLIPDDADDRPRRLVRLRMAVRIESGSDAVGAAYDLFPRDEWSDVEHHPADISIDVGKALTFIAPVVGEALGLKLSIPVRWTTRTVQIRTTDRMSNPVEWYVTDRAINEGFSAYLIARVPKGLEVSLRVTVVCELRRSGIAGRVTKATFRSGAATYALGSGLGT